VYRNGVKLGSADFTATNGTSVVLANACAAGDYVRFEGFLITTFNNAIANTNGAVGDSLIASVSASKLTGTQTIPRGTLPTGSVLQVVQTVKTDTFSTTSGSLTDITGMSVSITPTSATSKILVQYFIGEIGPGNDEALGIALLRGSTVIGAGATAGSRTLTSTAAVYANDRGAPQAFCFLDSPATTSSTTYKLQIYVNGGNTVHVNRSSTDTDSTTYARTASTITAMEIAA